MPSHFHALYVYTKFGVAIGLAQTVSFQSADRQTDRQTDRRTQGVTDATDHHTHALAIIRIFSTLASDIEFIALLY